jgi:hypothetical protein
VEPISDLTWIRQLSLSSVERLDVRGFGVAVVSIPATSLHHEERFRYRLLAFDPWLGKPILSVDLESDILGDFCLSLQLGSEHRVLARFDSPPSLAEFRERALTEAQAALPSAPLPPPVRGRVRKRRQG